MYLFVPTCTWFVADKSFIKSLKKDDMLCNLLTALTLICLFIMSPPLIGGGIKRCFCLTSDVCLSDV